MEGQDVDQPDLNEAQAAEKIAAILNRGKEPPPPIPETAVEPPIQEATTEAAPEEDENTISIDPEAPLFDVTVKVEGGGSENLKVSLKELESGFMMQKDYQRKTAELARARESLTQEVQKIVEPERQQYVQNLNILHQAVLSMAAPELQNVNWEQLAAEDPAKAVQLSAKAQRVQQTLQNIQNQAQQAKQQALAQQAEHCMRMLHDPIEGIPNWGPDKAKAVFETGLSLGYSQEELAQVVNYRDIKVLHELAEYRALKAAKPAVEKKVTVVPKVLRPGAPQSGDSQAKRVNELQQRLRASGSVKDAAALLAAQRKRNGNSR
jgi:molecular chaperone GrpE (heat shock protein)